MARGVCKQIAKDHCTAGHWPQRISWSQATWINTNGGRSMEQTPSGTHTVWLCDSWFLLTARHSLTLSRFVYFTRFNMWSILFLHKLGVIWTTTTTTLFTFRKTIMQTSSPTSSFYPLLSCIIFISFHDSDVQIELDIQMACDNSSTRIFIK